MRAVQPASVIEPALQQLAEVWRQRWPFPSAASPDAALTVHGVRRLILDALPLRVSREVVLHKTNSWHRSFSCLAVAVGSYLDVQTLHSIH